VATDEVRGKGRGGRRFVAEFGPGIAEGHIVTDRRQKPKGEGRGARPVSGFSAVAMRNLRKAALRVRWDEMGYVGLVTLTYPRDYPRNGRLAKRHLELLWGQWRTRFGERPMGIWGMEFQERGALHFHCFLRIPASPGGLPEDRYEDLRAWGFDVWSKLVGFPPVPEYELAWQRDRQLRFNVSPAWYADSLPAVHVAQYLVNHAGKGSQKTLPEDFEEPGRWWGVVGLGRGRSDVRRVELCCEESFNHFMRAVRRLQGGRRGRKRESGAQRRMWRGMDRWERERRRTHLRLVIRESRLRPYRVQGGWAAVSSGYACERLVPWAMSQCKKHGTAAATAHGPSSPGNG